MNVVPNGSVTFCKGVKLSKNNQRDFKSEQEQQEYFAEREWYKADKVQFIRAQGGQWSGSIKVPTQYYRLYTCDYLFYKNTGFSDKIFYCYITGVDYIDTATTRVQFAVDLYQQFLFDYKIDRATVIRKHFATFEEKQFNENFIDDIQVDGQYKVVKVHNKDTYLQGMQGSVQHLQDNFVLVVGFQHKELGQIIEGNQSTIFNNDFWPGSIWVWDLHDYSSALLNTIQGELKLLSVLSDIKFCYLYPDIDKIFTKKVQEPLAGYTGRYIRNDNAFYILNDSIQTDWDPDGIAKLQQNPYTKLQLRFSNGDGIDNIDMGLLKDPSKIEYTLVPRLGMHPQLTMYLRNYAGINTTSSNIFDVNLNYSCVTYDFPNIPVLKDSVIDTGQVLLQLTSKVVQQAVTGAKGLSKIPGRDQLFDKYYKDIWEKKVENVIDPSMIPEFEKLQTGDQYQVLKDQFGWSLEGANNRANRLVDRTYEKATNKAYNKVAAEAGKQVAYALTSMNSPVSISGGTTGGTWMSGYYFQISMYKYEISQMRLIKQYIERYGLSCYSIIDKWAPQRQRYDYVECQDIVINGNIPQEAKAYIGQMFTEGVMFWHDNNLFDYSNNGDV